MRRRPAALAAAWGCILIIAACGTPTRAAESLTSTSTLLADAAVQLAAVTTYHLVIAYHQGFADYTDDLRVRAPSDAAGTATLNGAGVDVVQTGGKLYVKGRDFVSEYGGDFAGGLFGDRWVQVTPDLLRAPVLDLARLTSLPSAFLAIPFDGTRTDHVAAATESTAALHASWGTLYITELPPHRLVKVESTHGFVVTAGISNVSFELLELGDPVDVRPPAQFGSTHDPTSQSPDFESPGPWRWGRCDYAACGFVDTVQNYGGTYPTAPSTFTFTLLTDPGFRALGSCHGAIPVVGNGKDVNIGCLVGGGAYHSYTGAYLRGMVTIDNPAFDG